MESPLFLKRGCMADLWFRYGEILVTDDRFNSFILDLIDRYEYDPGGLCVLAGAVFHNPELRHVFRASLVRLFEPVNGSPYFLNDRDFVSSGYAHPSELRRNALATYLIVGKEILTWNLIEGEDYEWI